MTEYILVTGATGFIGAHVVEQSLQKGYRVRVTARTAERGQALVDRYPQYKGKVDYVIVEDIGKEGAFAGHLEGLTGIFHLASPFILKVEDNKRDLLEPAVNGVLNVLKEAAKVKTIKRIVITASFACIYDGSKPAGSVYSEKDYNPITYQQAVEADSVTAYLASKRFAEAAAFEFVEKNKPQFDIVSLCPPMVYGPIAHHINKLTELGESASLVYELVAGKKEIGFYPFDLYIDVRDLAAAHILAFEKPEVSNQRFLTTPGNYSFQEIVDIAHKLFPGKIKASKGTPGVYLPVNTVADNTNVKKVLGLTFRPKEETFKDAIAQLLEFEAQGK